MSANLDSVVGLANQFGLFGITSVLLGLVGILLALGGLVAFFDVRRAAQATARAAAQEEARKVAEAVANAYMQAELPTILNEYFDLLKDSVTAQEADEIAQAQNDMED